MTLNGLWRNQNFVKLFIGETVSQLGSSVSLLALPLVALTTLHVSAVQIGILTLFSRIPYLLVWLFAGVLVDRVMRRSVMLWTNIGRAVILSWIPVAAIFHVLAVEQLYAVAFVTGVLTVVFNTAYPSFVPAVVKHDELVEANSKMEAGRGVTEIVGPAVAGFLVQVLTAPLAIIVDIFSFIMSILSLGLIRNAEPAVPQASRRGVLHEIGEGLAFLLRHPLLRTGAVAAGTWSFGISIMAPVYLLFLVRGLHLAPFVVGIVQAAGGPGSLVGSVLTSRITSRYGLGRTMAASLALGGLGALLIPLAANSGVVSTSLLVIAQLLMSCGIQIFNINLVSLRQTATPPLLLGRVNASSRFVSLGAAPIGTVIGTFFAQETSLRGTLYAAAVVILASCLWVVFSPLRDSEIVAPKVVPA